MPPARPTPWVEAIALRRAWHAAPMAPGLHSMEDRRPDEVAAWYDDLQAEVDRYAVACGRADLVMPDPPAIDPEVAIDPREALVRVLAVASAAIDALGRLDGEGPT